MPHAVIAWTGLYLYCRFTRTLTANETPSSTLLHLKALAELWGILSKMKKLSFMLLAVIAIISLSACKKEKPISDKLKVFFSPNSTGNTAYYVRVTAKITDQTGRELLSLNDAKPSPYAFNSDAEVKAGDKITVEYKSSSNEPSNIDFDIWWNGHSIYSFGNMDLNGKTGGSITVTIPEN